MSGPTLQERLAHITQGLTEAQRRFAADEPYPDPEGSWPQKIAQLQQHLAEVREMIANE
ncbi:hypothetical protein [Tunturibacter empetritectus]|uniref:Uncharacterized protein n=1 Tax=Tunturiibacter empetritectus TaxID=3069691 RepID=A0A7W8MQU9_9BACT|nr:hypothetical protein [Edaphobacter lichenicola]MBB5316933.1 hypothetical protein [Edaphobacter lichenicola]